MTDTAARPPWYRRTPPAGLPRFPRAIWWAGHGQLFIGPAVAAAGLVMALATKELYGIGLLLISMGLPFVTSGMMLRAHGVRQGRLTGRNWFGRVAELILVVVLIAALSVVFVVVIVFILMWPLGEIFYLGR